MESNLHIKKFLFFMIKKISPPGGLEPPAFRLTAERASQLRHGGLMMVDNFNVVMQHYLRWETFCQKTE